jgi:hypothetical protein
MYAFFARVFGWVQTEEEDFVAKLKAAVAKLEDRADTQSEAIKAAQREIMNKKTFVTETRDAVTNDRSIAANLKALVNAD